MSDGQHRPSRTLLDALVHHPIAILATVCLFLVGASVATVIRPVTYQASALMYLDERNNSTQGFDIAIQAGQLMSAHYIDIATSQPVLQRVCKARSARREACSTDQLAHAVSADTVKGTSMIAVSGRASTPRVAAELANDLARAVLDENRAEVESLLKPTSDHFDSQLDQLTKAIADEQSAIAALQLVPTAHDLVTAHQTQLTLLQSQYTDAYNGREQLVLQKYRLEGALALFQPASPPTRPVDPDPVLYLLVGLTAGIAAATGLALLLERVNDRIYRPLELAQAAASDLVMAVPADSARSDPDRLSRYYGLARAHILARTPDVRSMLVVAASERDRARPVALGMAAVAVRAGQKVLVLDAEGPDALAPGEAARLALTFKSVVSEASLLALLPSIRDYDLTIVSAPSPYSWPMTVLVARHVQVALVVATGQVTSFSDARRATEALRRTGIEVAGAIFVERRRGGQWRAADVGVAAVLEPPVAGSRLPTWRGPEHPSSPTARAPARRAPRAAARSRSQ